MEDVLAVYERPYDPNRPVVCLDEKLKELHDTPRGELTLAKGKPTRQDYEWQRNGSCNIFMAVEPLAGRRHVRVTDRHTSADFAHQLRYLVEDCYSDAQKIVLVTDNLNTHHTGCLYDAFEPERAFAIAQKIEWHYTPEHASWLNMAEIELSVIGKQCLDRRMPTKDEVDKHVKAWTQQRNNRKVKIDWQFTTADARIKLKRLYPKQLKST
jgi:transposase